MKKRLAVIGIVVTVVFGLGSFLVYYFTTGPMYEPGQVRQGDKLRAPLDPPAQVNEAVFQVTDTIALRHFESGSGNPVLVVHGGPGFPPARPYRGLDLVDGYRFIYYHQRGCGESTRPFDRLEGGFMENLETLEGSLGLRAQVADIERIRRILGEEKLVLLGHSFGAFIASLYAAEFPERVTALVLVAPAGVVKLPSEHGDLFTSIRGRLPESRHAAFDAWQERYLDMGGLFDKTEAELAALSREMGPFWAEAMAASGVRLHEETRSENNGGWMVFAMYLSMGMRHDYSRSFAAVSAPVLVIHGDKDLQSEAASREYLGYFANATFAVVPGAGHFPFLEVPEELAATLAPFLAKLAGY